MSSYQACGEALDAFLAALPNPPGDLVYEGQVYSPQRGKGWLASRLSGYARTPVGVGRESPMRIDGTYQVSIHRPAAEGRARAAAIASGLEAYFARGTALVTGTGTTLLILHASAQPAQPAGDWITVPVIVAWLCSEP